MKLEWKKLGNIEMIIYIFFDNTQWKVTYIIAFVFDIVFPNSWTNAETIVLLE